MHIYLWNKIINKAKEIKRQISDKIGNLQKDLNK